MKRVLFMIKKFELLKFKFLRNVTNKQIFLDMHLCSNIQQ